MPLQIVIGAQWGDEGKGRVVDLLSERSELVARYNGGDNAGHTVTVGEHIYKLHVIPSGIIHPRTVGVMGSGMVINPQTLVEEMSMLRAAGVTLTPERLWISDAAQLITPAHRLLDRAQDAALGKGKIGTTGRGIGPAYVDKASRRGLRASEILDEAAFSERVRAHFAEVSRLLVELYHQPALDADQLLPEYLAAAAELRPYIRRIGPLVQAALAQGQTVLAEGAQGYFARRGAGHLSVRDQFVYHLDRRIQRSGGGGADRGARGGGDQSLPDARRLRAFPDRIGGRGGRLPARQRGQSVG